MKYRLTTATSIVIANMVGTGVFTSLGFQLIDLSNTSTIIIMWTLGGFIALLGSFCYAELSSAFPRSGGEYHFLRISIGNATGFLSGWTSAIVGFSAPIAASAYAFAKYFSRVVPLDVSPVLMAGLVVVCVTAIHSLKAGIGARFQVFFTIGKILLLVIFIIAGLINAERGLQPGETLPTNIDMADFSKSGFWIGLIFVSYAYSGWNASSYIIDDIENPRKNVPRSIFIGTTLVTVLYVLLNFVFLISAPASEMRGKPEVADVAASHIFGPKGASIVSAMVSFFLISTIGSMIIVGPRVIKRIATDYREFSFFSVNNKQGVPLRAILLQSGIAIFLLATSSFEFIITAIGFILSIFTTCVAIGLIIMRIKRPEVTRNIRVPFFPITPLVFILFNIWTIAYVVMNRPKEALAGVFFVVAGRVIYFFLNKTGKTITGMMSALLLILMASACQNPANENLNKKSSENAQADSLGSHQQPPDFIPDPALNKRAALIAGLDENGFNDSSTRRLLAGLNQQWKRKSAEILEPITRWSKSEAIYEPAKSTRGKWVFYPFSGPDFEFANAFYPEADTYILCGLEKAGSRKALIFNHGKPADTFIKRAHKYFYYSDRVGFFRTLDMEAQFSESDMVDILALYIKRTGSQIESVELLQWDPGTCELQKADTTSAANACRFRFQYPSGKNSTLLYFSKDLSDRSLAKDSCWLTWIISQKREADMYTLVKSASYLLQSVYFTQMRDFILKNAKAHIQDDSGISYKQLAAQSKQLTLFGKYSKVIPVFSHFYQPELAEKFRTDSTKSLPFRIGYNTQHAEANLMVLK